MIYSIILYSPKEVLKNEKNIINYLIRVGYESIRLRMGRSENKKSKYTVRGLRRGRNIICKSYAFGKRRGLAYCKKWR